MQQSSNRSERKQIPFVEMTEEDMQAAYVRGDHPAHTAIHGRLHGHGGDTDDLLTRRREAEAN